MLRNPFALVRGLPATVRILVAGTFVNKLGTFVIPFLTIVLKREFHLSSTEVGALVMAYGAGSLVAILTGGVLTDRLGRRMTLLTSLLGSGALAVVLAFSPSVRVFATLLILFGFVADLYRPAATSIIAALLPSAQRAVGFAFALVFFSHITALPLTMTVNAGYPARLFGALIGTNGLLIALFEVSIVHRLRGWRRLRVAAVGTALVGLGFGLSGVFLHWAWFLVTVVIWTAGEILSTPFKMAFVTDWAPPALRGRYMSLYQATWSVAVALNPILFLPLQARLGDRRFWPVMLA